jgi:hypothetical protein
VTERPQNLPLGGIALTIGEFSLLSEKFSDESSSVFSPPWIATGMGSIRD